MVRAAQEEEATVPVRAASAWDGLVEAVSPLGPPLLALLVGVLVLVVVARLVVPVTLRWPVLSAGERVRGRRRVGALVAGAALLVWGPPRARARGRAPAARARPSRGRPRPRVRRRGRGGGARPPPARRPGYPPRPHPLVGVGVRRGRRRRGRGRRAAGPRRRADDRRGAAHGGVRRGRSRRGGARRAPRGHGARDPAAADDRGDVGPLRRPDDVARGDGRRAPRRAAGRAGRRTAARAGGARGTDISALSGSALSELPQGAFVKAVVSLAQGVVGSVPWRVTVEEQDADHLAVVVTRNGRAAGSAALDRAGLLRVDAADPTSAATAAQVDLYRAAAAVVLLTLARHHAGFDGLCGATSWRSLALQYVAQSDLAAAPDREQELLARAVDVDPRNDLAQVALAHAEGRHHTLREDLDAYGRWLDGFVARTAGRSGYRALRLRAQYSRAVTTVNACFAPRRDGGGPAGRLDATAVDAVRALLEAVAAERAAGGGRARRPAPGRRREPVPPGGGRGPGAGARAGAGAPPVPGTGPAEPTEPTETPRQRLRRAYRAALARDPDDGDPPPRPRRPASTTWRARTPSARTRSTPRTRSGRPTTCGARSCSPTCARGSTTTRCWPRTASGRSTPRSSARTRSTCSRSPRSPGTRRPCARGA